MAAPLWTPSDERFKNARITRFIHDVNDRHELSLAGFDELYQWSVDCDQAFWAAVWDTNLSDTGLQDLADGREPVFVSRNDLVFFARLDADEDYDQISGTTLTALNTPSTVNDYPTTTIRAAPRGRGRLRDRFTS